MFDTKKPESPEELLEETLQHFGVKGMRWGHRNARVETESSSSSSRFTPEQKARAKKIAIGTGILIGVAGAGYVAYSLHKNGNLPFRKVKPSPETTLKIERIMKEPTDIAFTSRGKDKGYRIYNRGNADPNVVYEHMAKAFGMDAGGGVFKKMDNGTIAASFFDPKGRKDASGRLIAHQVIIPRALAGEVNSLDDVVTKIWPTLETEYDPT